MKNGQKQKTNLQLMLQEKALISQYIKFLKVNTEKINNQAENSQLIWTHSCKKSKGYINIWEDAQFYL